MGIFRSWYDPKEAFDPVLGIFWINGLLLQLSLASGENCYQRQLRALLAVGGVGVDIISNITAMMLHDDMILKTSCDSHISVEHIKWRQNHR